MAQHKSAKKRIRSNDFRKIINHARINNIRTYINKVETAIKNTDKDLALLCFKKAESAIACGAQHGVMHKNTASRRISRLMKKINTLLV